MDGKGGRRGKEGIHKSNLSALPLSVQLLGQWRSFLWTILSLKEVISSHSSLYFLAALVFFFFLWFCYFYDFQEMLCYQLRPSYEYQVSISFSSSNFLSAVCPVCKAPFQTISKLTMKLWQRFLFWFFPFPFFSRMRFPFFPLFSRMLGRAILLTNWETVNNAFCVWQRKFVFIYWEVVIKAFFRLAT